MQKTATTFSNRYNYTKHELMALVQPPGTQQSVMNQPVIATMRHSVYINQSELFVAEMEKTSIGNGVHQTSDKESLIRD